LGEGEQIYLNGGMEQGLKVGDRFVVLKTLVHQFMHPIIAKKKLGDVIQQVGVVRVIHTQAKSSTAVIERSLDAVSIGDHLTRFVEPANIPTQLRTDTAEPVKISANAAMVIYSRDAKLFSSGGDMMIIDKGSNDGLKVGEVLLVARNRSFAIGSDTDKHPATDSTTYYLGQALVVRTEAQTSTCRVLRSIEEMRKGDLVTQ
jgi:hypothetical protein